VGRPAAANRKALKKETGTAAKKADVEAAPEAAESATGSVAEPPAAPAPLIDRVAGAVDALKPLVSELVEKIEAGGSDAPDRPAVEAVADTLTQLANDLALAYGD
jgi:hypothetical protein